MRRSLSAAVCLITGSACILGGCRRSSNNAGASVTHADGSPPATSVASSTASPAGVDLELDAPSNAQLAAKGLFVMIREAANERSPEIGYLRLGGRVARSDKPVGFDACPGGWYAVQPYGFACLDQDGSLDPSDAVVRAASRRPDLSKPMPYAYGFVRAVSPLYLRIPTEAEQMSSEFKLREHLDWWRDGGWKENRDVVIGANDVFIDMMGVPHDETRVAKPSTQMTEAELFGGAGENDPVPWWLEGGRKIPNVARFQVPEFAVFADRVRRHTGLAFVGSFPTGAESMHRRFAITEDLRLAPTTKVKPDSGSPFHGVALDATTPLPLAWIKEPDTRQYRLEGTEVRMFKKRLAYRSIVKLTGKKQLIDNRLYYEMQDGKWVRAKSIGLAAAPASMPDAARMNEKWIDISIRQQVLVLWEGTQPVYTTLVSTGQDMLGDPKTTKSTVLGTFRIQSKHVTTAMDSSEGLSRESGDPEYGVSKRRGQGSFLLDHVPWVMYFRGSYALHGTYWHDVFGTARSHGCVNLSPIDAHRVFFWVLPRVPRGWHAAYARGAGGEGTVVYIHE